MLQIAMCEDEASVQEYLKGREWSAVPCGVHVFRKGEKLTDADEAFDLLVLSCRGADSVAYMRDGLRGGSAACGEQAPEPEREPFLVRANGSYYQIEPEKILYVENVGRKVTLHLKNSELSYYARMKEVEEQLGGHFFRCHRGYLVNFKAVESYETGSILLKNGERILMAKQKYNAFADRYADYLRRK